ncbi:MAG: hypothetical protein QXQ79_00950 [Candidatus Nanoarchaeia archaeon]
MGTKDYCLFPYVDNSGNIYQIGKIQIENLIKTIEEKPNEGDIYFLEGLLSICEKYIELPHDKKNLIRIDTPVFSLLSTRDKEISYVDFCTIGVENTKKFLENGINTLRKKFNIE